MSYNTNISSLWTSLLQNYIYVMVDLGDKRVDDWLLMYSVWPTVGACMVYFYIMKVAGPRFMKNREPYNIQNIMIAYNFAQTLLSAWIFQKACRFWLSGTNRLEAISTLQIFHDA